MNSNLTKKLIKLVNENPNLPIIASTNSDVIGGDDSNYWVGDLSEVFVDYTYLCERQEKWMWGEDDIKDILYENEKYVDDNAFDNITGKETQKYLDDKFNQLIENGKVNKCIIMRIDP